MASLAGENGGGRRLGVDGVRLAAEASILSARPDDLQHQVAFALQVAGQSDAVAAGSLNPESDHLTVAPRRGQKSRIAASRGRDLEVPKIATELVFGMPDMAVLVGVDADRDAYWIVCVCDAGCCHRLSSIGVIGGRLPGGRTALRWGLCQPPIRSLLARRVAAGTVVAGRERQILKGHEAGVRKGQLRAANHHPGIVAVYGFNGPEVHGYAFDVLVVGTTNHEGVA